MPLVYCLTWNAALDSSGVLQPHHRIPLAQHITIILITTLFHILNITLSSATPQRPSSDVKRGGTALGRMKMGTANRNKSLKPPTPAQILGAK